MIQVVAWEVVLYLRHRDQDFVLVFIQFDFSWRLYTLQPVSALACEEQQGLPTELDICELVIIWAICLLMPRG